MTAATTATTHVTDSLEDSMYQIGDIVWFNGVRKAFIVDIPTTDMFTICYDNSLDDEEITVTKRRINKKQKI